VVVDGGDLKFHREELLIYTLIVLKHGHTHTVMADQVTGGDSRRWSYGYKFMIKHIDSRYMRIIGPRGLEQWVQEFPRFLEAIRQNVAGDRHFYNRDDDVWTTEPGVNFVPGDFSIVGFADCCSNKTCRPGSGPDGDYP
jgi:hypothetical protein